MVVRAFWPASMARSDASICTMLRAASRPEVSSAPERTSPVAAPSRCPRSTSRPPCERWGRRSSRRRSGRRCHLRPPGSAGCADRGPGCPSGRRAVRRPRPGRSRCGVADALGRLHGEVALAGDAHVERLAGVAQARGGEVGHLALDPRAGADRAGLGARGQIGHEQLAELPLRDPVGLVARGGGIGHVGRQGILPGHLGDHAGSCDRESSFHPAGNRSRAPTP